MDTQAEDIDIDMNAALASMQDDFEPGAEPPVAESPPEAPAPTAQPEPWRALPKSWKQDLAPIWAKADPALMQYAHEREKQALDGIMGYKTKYDPYGKLEEHYKPWLEHYKVNLPDITQRMLNSHLALLQATPEVKQKYLQELVQDYGLEPLLKQMYGSAAAPPADPNAAMQQLVQQAVQQAVAPLHQKITSREQAEAAAAEQAMLKEIDSFVANPENPYASELLEDMTRVSKGGLASTLKEAYEMACRINPGVWKKIQDAEVARLATPPAPAPKNVRSGSAPPASTKPQDEDMEATMRRTLKEIQSR